MSNNEKKIFRSMDAEGRAFQERWELDFLYVHPNHRQFKTFLEEAGAMICHTIRKCTG